MISSHIVHCIEVWKYLLCIVRILNQSLYLLVHKACIGRCYQEDIKKKFVKENISANRNTSFRLPCKWNYYIYILYYHIIAMVYNIYIHKKKICLQPTDNFTPINGVYIIHFILHYCTKIYMLITKKKCFPYIHTLFQRAIYPPPHNIIYVLYVYNNPNSWSPVARKIFCRQFELSFPIEKSYEKGTYLRNVSWKQLTELSFFFQTIYKYHSRRLV